MTDRERVLWVMLIVALLAIGLTWWNVASAAECPAGTELVPFGAPDDTGYHHIYQPNQPAAYVYAVAPDGTRFGPFPFGTYGPNGAGQWFVCYTEDVEPFRYLATPPTTVVPTTTVPIAIPMPASTASAPRLVSRWGNRMNIAI